MDKDFMWLLIVILAVAMVAAFLSEELKVQPLIRVTQPVTDVQTYRIAIDRPYKITTAEVNTVELKLPDDIILLKGSSFIADVEMDSVEVGDQVIVIMLKRSK